MMPMRRLMFLGHRCSSAFLRRRLPQPNSTRELFSSRRGSQLMTDGESFFKVYPSETNNREARIVRVENFNSSCSWMDLDVHLRSTGLQVDFIRVLKDVVTGSSLKAAFVQFQTPEMAQEAVNQFDKSRWEERLLKVSREMEEDVTVLEQEYRNDLAARKVYIRNVALEATEEQIQSHLKSTKNFQLSVLETRLVLREGQKWVEDAAKAVEAFHASFFLGRQLALYQFENAQDEINHRTVYVGNLSFETSSEELRQLLSSSGLIVEAVQVMMDYTTHKSKGFGFATFATPDMAESAVASFTGAKLSNRALYLRNKKESLYNSVDKDHHKVLYIRNIPRDTSPHDLAKHFGVHGEVVFSDTIQPNPKENYCFGIVKMKTAKAAEACIDKLHGTLLRNRVIQVQLKKARDNE